MENLFLDFRISMLFVLLIGTMRFTKEFDPFSNFLIPMITLDPNIYLTIFFVLVLVIHLLYHL